jgi:hypothetical protein
MTDAFIIETATLTAGIVAAQGGGFRFYASHPSMFPLEGAFFDTLKACHRAVERLERESRKNAADTTAPNDAAGRWGTPPTIAA